MNITLSADADTVKKTREIARKRGTSLNGLIRDYMRSVADQQDRENVAQAFTKNALTSGGKSSTGFRFCREDAHQR